MPWQRSISLWPFTGHRVISKPWRTWPDPEGTEREQQTVEQHISMHGRRLHALSNTSEGEVSAETIFEFSQEVDLVWARYAGGHIRLGFLVGINSGTQLDFRYAQINHGGDTSTGHSQDRIELLADGRVRLHEAWSWDSHEGRGTSILEEIVNSSVEGHLVNQA